MHAEVGVIRDLVQSCRHGLSILMGWGREMFFARKRIGMSGMYNRPPCVLL
jgi:hypothetical protein